jgi:3-oxoisoapionate decarboxylase
MNRRELLSFLAASGCATAAGWAGKALGAATSTRTTAGVVIYCFGLRREAERRRDPGADLFEPLSFLEHCRGLGAGGIQVPLGARDAEYAARLRRRAEEEGMFVEGIVNPPRDAADLDRFDAQMRTAALAGAQVVRTVILPGRRYEFFESAEQFRQYDLQARKSVELAAPVARRHRVRLAIENHKDHRIAERIALLEHIGSEWVGACVDLGNDISLLEDPIESVRAYAPWAMSVHLKDQAVAEYDDGFLLADVPLGQGFLDLKTMVSLLREAKPEVRFVLEIITRDPLRMPCLTETYWATLAEVPGRDLARTLRMVRRHAAESLPRVSTLSAEERVAREHRNVVESLAFAREEIG